MAHQIDMTTGKAAMAYVGEKPWHGLGQELTAGTSLDIWAKEAGMDWTIKQAVPTFKVDGADDVVAFDNRKILYRSDTNAPLSVVSDSYKIVQPREVLEFFRDLVSSAGGMTLETAGCLFGGSRYWALASTGRQESVLGGGKDPVKGMLLLTTSCDGSIATMAKFTSVRVVCNNTLKIALSNAAAVGDSIKVTHNSVFDPMKIKSSLGLLDAGWEKFAATLHTLADAKISDAGAKKFIAEIMLNAKQLDDYNKGVKLHERIANKLDTVFSLYDGKGMGADDVRGSLWGAVNAVTEYVDHHVGRIPDNALWNSWFGAGETMKNNAFEKAVEWAV